MSLKTSFLYVVISFVFCFGHAQQSDLPAFQELDEVVITDSKFELKRENSGKVIAKITQKELENLPGKSVAEIVNTISGIEINGARSNAGQNFSYIVRGGRNRQVLILIDGIAVSDPSRIANDFDLHLLNTDQIETIEILKGAASTLYGTGAATAVINIKMKEAGKKPIAGTFKTIFGTNQSQNNNTYSVENFLNTISVNGTVSKFNYLANFGHQYTDGLSAVANGAESDPYEAQNIMLNLGYRFSEVLKLNAFGSVNSFDTNFDNTNLTDANNISNTKQTRIGFSSEYKYSDGGITINAAYNHIKREVQSSFPSKFNAESYTIDAFNRYHFDDHIYTVLGLNIQDNLMESFAIPFGESDFQQSINPGMASFNSIDPYFNAVFVFDIGLNINSGLRLNNHSTYGSHLVYSINPSFKEDTAFGYIKGLASYSTAFITPSLFQLFEPSYGNTQLKPEENRTIEGGIELAFNKTAGFSFVYFNREESNFIDFTLVDADNFVYQYDNVNQKFTASGVEFEGYYKLNSKLKFNLNGTYTKVDDKLNLRIPKLKANAKIDFRLSNKTFMSLAYQYNASREDVYFDETTFEANDLNLSGYGLLDYYISHKIINNKTTLFANITNILNEEYQELFGYSTKGRNINIGVQLNF